MFSSSKDEYQEATKNATINTHGVIVDRWYRVTFLNIFLSALIGISLYLGLKLLY